MSSVRNEKNINEIKVYIADLEERWESYKLSFNRVANGTMISNEEIERASFAYHNQMVVVKQLKKILDIK